MAYLLTLWSALEQRLLRDERGAESIEWLVMVSLLVSLLVVLTGLMKTALPAAVSTMMINLINSVMRMPG